MAQHDYDLINQSGSSFRADLNNALDAIASNNSGSSEPSTKFAYEWWIDTTNNLLKLRNSANNAWITLPLSITADNATSGALTVNGNLVTTGTADISNSLLLKGTTPTLTIGDGGEEDTKIVFDGNAQDYYIGLDDSADDLIIGKGSTVGTTPALSIDENLNSTFAGTTTTTGYVIGNNTALFDDHSTLSAFSDSNGVYLNGKNAGWLSLSGDGNQRTHIRLFGQSSSAGEIITFNTANAERMRINSAGNLGINTTSPTATFKFTIDAGANHGGRINNIGSGYSGIVTKANASNNYFPMYFENNAGGGVGYILSDSTSTVFSVNGSDIAFKENVKDWDENVLESFKNIKPSTFTYKSDENKKEIKGYIAQNEVDKFPEAYPINPKDGKRWFNPSGMTVYLMKAIQEQQTIIDDLKSRIETLEG